MAERKITNCSECAYAKKTDQGLWCPFHDEPVSSKLVCDDFLGEYETPQWASLMTGMNGQKNNPKTVSQYTAWDIVCYILTLIILGLCIALLLLKL